VVINQMVVIILVFAV